MTRREQAERQEAIDQLREWIKPGDTVYTVLDHVSRSGMSRQIRVAIPYVKGPSVESVAPGGKPTDYVRRDGIAVDFIHPNYAIGRALGMKHGKRNGRELDSLTVGGCGMDMGFHLVYSLSATLYGWLRCEAPGCRKYPSGEYRTVIEGQDGGRLTVGEPLPLCEYCGAGLVGGYACLGAGACSSNYHVNYRRSVRCEGEPFCYRADLADGFTREVSEVGAISVKWAPFVVPVQATDGSVERLEVCPRCEGAGYLPNPSGPERFDLHHVDGYALRHRWL